MRISLAVALAAQIIAGPSLTAQMLPPVRPLGPVAKVSPPDILGSVSMVRPLSDGSVLVNDFVRRQIVLLDRNFKLVRGIVDATTATGGPMGGSFYGLLPFKGDTSLVVDPSSLSMLVVDATGEVVRVMALPSVNDALLMIGGPYGTPGIDAHGRWIFLGGPAATRPSSEATPAAIHVSVDTAPLRRVDLATREREILTYLKIPSESFTFLRDSTDRISGLIRQMNPAPIVDGWALMPDGRVAVVRGKDYHVDWLGLEGKWTPAPKVPFNWERLDAADKQRLVDSSMAAYRKEREQPNRDDAKEPGSPPPSTARGRVDVQMTVRMEIDDSQDYRPAFLRGSVRADTDGNLWVRTTVPTNAGAIYDVINGQGQLVDRVRLPFGRVISGFGPGVVYLGVLDVVGARLEMARIR